MDLLMDLAAGQGTACLIGCSFVFAGTDKDWDVGKCTEHSLPNLDFVLRPM